MIGIKHQPLPACQLRAGKQQSGKMIVCSNWRTYLLTLLTEYHTEPANVPTEENTFEMDYFVNNSIKLLT